MTSMITERFFEFVSTIQSQVLKPAVWGTNVVRLQYVLTNLGQTYIHDLREGTENRLTHLMGAIIREGESGACAVALPAEV